MASTTIMTSALPQGSLKHVFAKLDDDIYNSLAASQPGSPSLNAFKGPILQPSEHITLLSQQNSAPAPTSQPTGKSTATSTVLTLLTTPNLTAEMITPLTTPDATFLCPHWCALLPHPQHDPST
jgi:hypothetical protein